MFRAKILDVHPLFSSSATGESGGLVSQSDSGYDETHWALFSNITNLYSKVRANRADVDKKCPRTKCDKILKKVKKVKASVEFIQTANITVLEALVDMLKNSSTAESLVDLAPIKACMTDPTVTVAYSQVVIWFVKKIFLKRINLPQIRNAKLYVPGPSF